LQPNQELLACAQHGRIEGVKDALRNGADINSITNDDPSTALDLAIFYGHYVIANYLLNQGATVGNFALIDSMDNEDIFVRLLDNISTNMRDLESLSFAINELAKEGKSHLIRLLEEKIQKYNDNKKC